jgi:hypothetical protein
MTSHSIAVVSLWAIVGGWLLVQAASVVSRGSSGNAVPALVGAACAALIALEFEWHKLGKQTVAHPLTASIAAGVVLLALAGLAVDQAVMRRKAQRWDAVAEYATGEISRAAGRVLHDLLRPIAEACDACGVDALGSASAVVDPLHARRALAALLYISPGWTHQWDVEFAAEESGYWSRRHFPSLTELQETTLRWAPWAPDDERFANPIAQVFRSVRAVRFAAFALATEEKRDLPNVLDNFTAAVSGLLQIRSVDAHAPYYRWRTTLLARYRRPFHDTRVPATVSDHVQRELRMAGMWGAVSLVGSVLLALSWLLARGNQDFAGDVWHSWGAVASKYVLFVCIAVTVLGYAQLGGTLYGRGPWNKRWGRLSRQSEIFGTTFLLAFGLFLWMFIAVLAGNRPIRMGTVLFGVVAALTAISLLRAANLTGDAWTRIGAQTAPMRGWVR